MRGYLNEKVDRSLMRRARNWVRHNECPLPLDLTLDLMAAGIDATEIEEQLLKENEEHHAD